MENRVPPPSIGEVASGEILDLAFAWLSRLWAALDALVLKAVAIVLGRRLRLARGCYHLPGQEGEKRGAKAAIREVCGHLKENTFVFRTDVKCYYASIDHNLLLEQLRKWVQRRGSEASDDPCLLGLVEQYARRTMDENCLYSTVQRGISLGCPLSPIMGALYLALLDKRMESTGLFYVRFMDDWVILAPTRWSLRRAVKLVNQTLAELKLEPHPDQTFLGRIERGFTFLGYQISGAGVIGVAPSAYAAFQERLVRLYEQNATPDELRRRVGQYVRRWRQWAVSGLGNWAETSGWFAEGLLPSSTQAAQVFPSAS